MKQNETPNVSIAIPKAKKPVKYERVSAGVYRGSNGDLKRSASNPTKSPGLTSGKNPGERFLPGRPTRKPGLGTGAEMTIQPFPGPQGSLKDVFDRMKGESAGPMPGNTDDLFKNLRDILGGMGNMQPAPRPNTRDIDPGFEVKPEDLRGSLYDLVRSAETPQIPRASGSISDMLRRR
jgi:hypothetical protein